MTMSPLEVAIFTLIFIARLLTPLAVLGLLALAATALIGFRRRSRDRALALLDAFPAVIEHESGVRHAGVLRVRDDGITLEFAIPATGHSPTLPITYLHYGPENEAINAIYRFVDELDKQDRTRRQQQIDAVSNPLGRRQPRAFTFWPDRLADWMVGLWMGLHRRAFPETDFHPHPVTGGSLLTGLAGDGYNALLQALIGKPVVVRHRTAHSLHRHQGVLTAYSPRFLFLTGAPLSEQVQVRPSPEKGAGQELTLRWQWENGRLEIRNQGAYPLLLDRIQVGDRTQELSMMVEPEQGFALHVTPPERGEILLHARITREADMLLPRRRAIVRLAAQLPGPLAAMDAALALQPSREQEAEEQRLRRELQQHPQNAPAAVALARLLAQRGELAEAEEFYQQALAHARNLPDQGDRARLELDQLRIRRAEEGGRQYSVSSNQ